MESLFNDLIPERFFGEGSRWPALRADTCVSYFLGAHASGSQAPAVDEDEYKKPGAFGSQVGYMSDGEHMPPRHDHELKIKLDDDVPTEAQRSAFIWMTQEIMSREK